MPATLTHLPTIRTRIVDTNARYIGVNVSDLMEKAGEGIAKHLVKKYGKRKSYALICGIGNNGGDGFAAARHLNELGVTGTVTVYLVGRHTQIKADAAANHWRKLQKYIGKHNPDKLTVKQDAFAKDIKKHSVFVECLVGTGINGKLNKRFRDVITRSTRLHGKMVAIDIPVPGYTWDLSISMMYPKTSDAISVDIGMPTDAELYVGPGEVQSLFKPNRISHKGQNGKLLILAGSEQFHGALVLSATAASKYAGLIYIYTDRANRHLIPDLETDLAEYIEVSDNNLEQYVENADAILVGPGWDENMVNKSVLDHLLKEYPDKKYVIDGGGLAMSDLELVKNSGNVIFTPHRGELPRLLKQSRKNQSQLQGTLRRFCAEYNCYVNLKGSTSLLFGKNLFTDQVDMRINRTGNQGMAKGGTGDMLAGITAAFATKNELWLSMLAGAFTTGIAGDIAESINGHMYSASDSVFQLQEAWQQIIDF